MAEPLEAEPAKQRRPDKRWFWNALLPALAALAGAGIAGGVTVYVTHDQDQAEQHQAVDAFVRTQRQAAYSAFVNDADALKGVLGATKGAQLAEENNLSSKLQNDLTTILLVGSKPVIAAASNVNTSAIDFQDDVVGGTPVAKMEQPFADYQALILDLTARMAIDLQS